MFSFNTQGKDLLTRPERLLDTKSTDPKNVRQPEHTNAQYARLCALRRQHPRWGKEKLLRIYQEEYPKDKEISLWHIQRIIQRSGICYYPQKNEQRQRKRRSARAKPRPRIQTPSKEAKSGFLLCLDTVQRSARGSTRYIYTAVYKYSKVAFAHAYITHSSTSAKDFLCRLHCLLDGKIANIQTDNGSNERFNRTLCEEFLQMGNMIDDTTPLNERLTE